MRCRFALLAASGLFSCLASGQDNMINYSTPAVPASQVFDAISRATQTKLRLEAPLDSEPLVVRLRWVRLEDALPMFAQVLHAEWRDDGNVKILRRTTYEDIGLRNLAARARMDRTFRGLQALIMAGKHPWLSREEAARTVEQAYTSPNEAAMQTPERLLVNRILPAINPSEVANAPFPSHIVYTTTPRLLQYKLRLGGNDLASIYHEQNVWTAAVAAYKVKYPKIYGARRFIDTKAAKIRVVLFEAQDRLPTQIEVRVLDKNGIPYVRARLPFVAYPPVADSGSDWSELKGRTLQLNATSREFLGAFNSGNSAASPALANVLKNPSATDPLQLVVSDGLLQLAESRNWNMIANPSDSGLFNEGFRAFASEAPQSALDFIKALQQTENVTLEKRTLFVSPRDGDQATSSRTDRVALQRLIDSVDRVGYAIPSAESEFLKQMAPNADPRLAEAFIERLHPGLHPFLGSSLEALAFVGTLTPEQRKTLLDGMSLKPGDLTPAQRDVLPAMILSNTDNVWLRRKTDQFTYAPYVEITDLVDSKIPPGATVSFEDVTEKVVHYVGVDSEGRGVEGVVTNGDAGQRLTLLGPWKSLTCTAGISNTRRVVVQISPDAQIVCPVRDLPSGFDRGPVPVPGSLMPSQ